MLRAIGDAQEAVALGVDVREYAETLPFAGLFPSGSDAQPTPAPDSGAGGGEAEAPLPGAVGRQHLAPATGLAPGEAFVEKGGDGRRLATGPDQFNIDGDFVRVEGVRGLDGDGESSLEPLPDRERCLVARAAYVVARAATEEHEGQDQQEPRVPHRCPC